MTLQRSNFRCSRDLTLPNCTLVASHAELPPRQRKRIHEGSTNRHFQKSSSNPSLHTIDNYKVHRNKDEQVDLDISTSLQHITCSNLALIKATQSQEYTSLLPSSIRASTSKSVAKQQRNISTTPLSSHSIKEAPLHSDNNESCTEVSNEPAPVVTDSVLDSKSFVDRKAVRDEAIESELILIHRKKLYDHFVSKYGSVRAVFRTFDKDGHGRISYQRFRNLMEASDVDLTPREIDELYKTVDLNGDNAIEFEEFAKMFSADNFKEENSAFHPSIDPSIPKDLSNTISLKFHRDLNLSPQTKERMEQLRDRVTNELEAKHSLYIDMHGGTNEKLLLYVFKQFDANNDGYLSYKELKTALGKEYLKLSMSSSDMDEMIGIIDRNGDGEIGITEFIQYFGTATRKIPLNFIGNARERELALLQLLTDTPLTPREEIQKERSQELSKSIPSCDLSSRSSPRSCLQEELAKRTAGQSVYKKRQLSKVAELCELRSSRSMPSIPTISNHLSGQNAENDKPQRQFIPQDRCYYIRNAQVDWSRVGVGGDGTDITSALYISPQDRFKTTALESYSPLNRSSRRGDAFFRPQKSTSTLEYEVLENRRKQRYLRTQAQLQLMEENRAKECYIKDWKARAIQRKTAQARHQYLNCIHEQEKILALRHMQMEKRHGGPASLRMWAGSAESQFNTQCLPQVHQSDTKN